MRSQITRRGFVKLATDVLWSLPVVAGGVLATAPQEALADDVPKSETSGGTVDSGAPGATIIVLQPSEVGFYVVDMSTPKKRPIPGAHVRVTSRYNGKTAEGDTDELGAQVGVWFDLSIAKRAGSEQANPVAVHTTDEPLKLTVAVPQTLRAGTVVTRTFYVLRVHDGKVDVLAKGAGNALDIESDRYSTYLLAYADSAQSGQAEKSGQTGKPGQTAATGTTSGGSSVVSTTPTQATARTGDTTPGIALLATLAAALLGLGCALRASRVR